MVSLLPEAHGVHFPTLAPRFRDWKPSTIVVTNIQYFEFLTGLVDRLVHDAGDQPQRWQKLVEESNHVSPADRRKIRDELLRRVDSGLLVDADRDALWEALRKLIARHREYSDADGRCPTTNSWRWRRPHRSSLRVGVWSVTRGCSKAICPILVGRSARTASTTTRGTPLRCKNVAMRPSRQSRPGEGGGRLSADRAATAWWVGQSLAEVGDQSVEEQCLSLLDADGGPESQFSMGYFERRFRQSGWEWLTALIRDRLPIPSRLRASCCSPAIIPSPGARLTTSVWMSPQTIGVSSVPWGSATDTPTLRRQHSTCFKPGRPGDCVAVASAVLQA